jgi:hypothetical protein
VKDRTRRNINRQTRSAIGNEGFSASNLRSRGSSEWLRRNNSSGRYDQPSSPYLLTCLTLSSYPLIILSISSRPNVRCRLFSSNSFGLSPLREVKTHRSENILKASIAEGVTRIPPVESLRGKLGEEVSDAGRSKISITACRSVAAAVEETTDTRDSCNLKHRRRALSQRQYRCGLRYPAPHRGCRG